SFLPVIVTVFFLKIAVFSRLVFGQAMVLMFLSLCSWRIIKRCMVRRLVAQGYRNLNVLIIGAGRVGRSLAGEIKNTRYLGLRVIGYLDDGKAKGEPINGHDVLGKISDFEDVIRNKFIDEVFITIPSERQLISDLIMNGRDLGVSMRIVPDFYDLALGEVRIHNLGFFPLLEYHRKGIHGTEILGKRVMDICLSGLGLMLLSPLFLILAVIIKLDSRGAVFYKSERCGKKSKAFYFYKFRSMVSNAEELKEELLDKNEVSDGVIFKIKKDPRITAIGSFMRKYSLDELPQLWNVFKGDMSLVGPRPPTPDEVVKYKPWQMRRLDIRPGITCLWQVRGRSDLSFYKWVKWDLWYIDNWSFTLDLRILLWTIPIVLKGKGAY
ncbi:MAG: sugar transferase, partial [Candidatus Omnitrophica bacterium]|nr:sugar transferase [Candidatus Omnitrophota bacterium]